jgi:ABC-type transporter Mla subunit MlaD
MDITTALKAFESLEKSSEVGVRRNTRELPRGQAERDDVKTSADDLAALLRQLSDDSMREIDQFINQLQRLRTQLRTTGDRIQSDIAEYAELSEQVMQLTSIICDGVEKLPRSTNR